MSYVKFDIHTVEGVAPLAVALCDSVNLTGL